MHVIQHDVSWDTAVTAKSTWRLLMSWCLVGTRTFATTIWRRRSKYIKSTLFWWSALNERSWWRHQMETFSALPVTGEFLVSWGWWVKTPSHPLWRHCNVSAEHVRCWGTRNWHETGCVNSLPWRHNERDSVSNHRRLYCLLNCLFRRRSKNTSKLRVTGLYAGNWPVNSSHKGPVTRKMTSSCATSSLPAGAGTVNSTNNSGNIKWKIIFDHGPGWVHTRGWYRGKWQKLLISKCNVIKILCIETVGNWVWYIG